MQRVICNYDTSLPVRSDVVTGIKVEIAFLNTQVPVVDMSCVNNPAVVPHTQETELGTVSCVLPWVILAGKVAALTERVPAWRVWNSICDPRISCVIWWIFICVELCTPLPPRWPTCAPNCHNRTMNWPIGCTMPVAVCAPTLSMPVPSRHIRNACCRPNLASSLLRVGGGQFRAARFAPAGDLNRRHERGTFGDVSAGHEPATKCHRTVPRHFGIRPEPLSNALPRHGRCPSSRIQRGLYSIVDSRTLVL